MRLFRLILLVGLACWLVACSGTEELPVSEGAPTTIADEANVMVGDALIVESSTTVTEGTFVYTDSLYMPAYPLPTHTPDPMVNAPRAHPLGVLTPAILNAQGEPPNDQLFYGLLSDDGRFIAFHSRADNLVANDTNEEQDVFLLDRESGEIQRVSVAPDGSEARGSMYLSDMSADGRYVLFWSFGGNPFPQSFEGGGQVYMRDTAAGTTEIVSVSGSGEPSNGYSHFADITPDGRYILFESSGDNLVEGDTNTLCSSAFTGATGLNCSDYYVHDRQNGTTERVSVLPDGTQGNGGVEQAVISDDGRWVAFSTSASNFLPNDPNDGACYDPPTDRMVNCPDLFLHDRESGSVTLIGKRGDGTPGNRGTLPGGISADGRYIIYASESDDLVEGDTNGVEDVFLYDRETDSTTRLSIAPDGSEGNGTSWGGQITPDGRYVFFDSHANNLVAGDEDAHCAASLYGAPDRTCADGFMLDRETNELTLLTVMGEEHEISANYYVSDFTPDARLILLGIGYSTGYEPPHYLYLLERRP